MLKGETARRVFCRRPMAQLVWRWSASADRLPVLVRTLLVHSGVTVRPAERQRTPTKKMHAGCSAGVERLHSQTINGGVVYSLEQGWIKTFGSRTRPVRMLV